MIAAVFEGVADYARVEEGELIYGQWGHVGIKIVVLLLNILFLYGFLISGKLLKNYLMKIASALMIIALLVFYIYDIVTVFSGTLDVEVVFLAEAVVFGAVGVFFGISILKSGKLIRTLAFASGGLELLMSFCFLIIVLAPLALFLFFPTVILETVLLYKIATMVKEQI